MQANSDECKGFAPDSPTVPEAVPGNIESDAAGDKRSQPAKKATAIDMKCGNAIPAIPASNKTMLVMITVLRDRLSIDTTSELYIAGILVVLRWILLS